MNTHKTTHKERGATVGPRTEVETFVALWEVIQDRYARPAVRRIVEEALEAARTEGRQQAVREIADTLTEHSDHLPITSDGENLRCSPDDAILVAGLNASECGCRHWIRHVVADLWEETPERKVCPECHHDYHPNGPCVAGLNASEADR